MADTSNLPQSYYYTQKIDFSKALDPSSLKDKSVIVTGGSNGLGQGCATTFAKAGAYVTILDINEEKGNAVTEELKQEGYHVQFVRTDTASFSSQIAGFKAAIAFSPSKTIDIVVTSAGLTGNNVQAWLEKASSNPDADPEPPSTATFDVNLTGLYYSTHLALHYFKQTFKPGDTSSKQLILISSLAGYVPLNNVSDYQASKFGVRGMWKAFRYSTDILGENAPPFRTNLICPTFIRTNMTTEIESGLLQLGISLGEIEDVVAGVIRCATDETISGRAVAIAARDKVAGDRNFDLDDDWEGLNAGRAVVGKIRDGTLKGLELVGISQYRGGKDENPLKDVRG